MGDATPWSSGNLLPSLEHGMGRAAAYFVSFRVRQIDCPDLFPRMKASERTFVLANPGDPP